MATMSGEMRSAVNLPISNLEEDAMQPARGLARWVLESLPVPGRAFKLYELNSPLGAFTRLAIKLVSDEKRVTSINARNSLSSKFLALFPKDSKFDEQVLREHQRARDRLGWNLRHERDFSSMRGRLASRPNMQASGSYRPLGDAFIDLES